MKVALASDHAGFPLKQLVVEYVRELGHEAVDLGTHNTDSVDYPDYAEKVGLAVRGGQVERGIVICGSGVGASVAANKVTGIRAGLCHDAYSAGQGVEHDDMNVLVLGARVIGSELAKVLVSAYLNAKFTNDERHVKRLKKVLDIEKRY